MQALKQQARRWRPGRIALAAAAVILALVFRRCLVQVAGLLAGSGVLAFLALPLARLLERRLPRPAAAVAALVTLGLGAALAALLVLPALARELIGLAEALPRSLGALTEGISQATGWLAALFPGLELPTFDAKALLPAVPDLATGALAAVSGVAGAAGKASMMAILACFLLSGREELALRAELLLPARARPMAVGMGCAVLRELKLYLRAQLLIALAVGGTAAVALLALRVRSAVVLGMGIGALNVIPYFGPFLGGVPAVLIALGDGVPKAALTVAALCLVQQLDGGFISPRIMGAVTGLSPAVVLVALFAGAELAGVVGMLAAVPALIVFRTLFRVSVQRRENI